MKKNVTPKHLLAIGIILFLCSAAIFFTQQHHPLIFADKSIPLRLLNATLTTASLLLMSGIYITCRPVKGDTSPPPYKAVARTGSASIFIATVMINFAYALTSWHYYGKNISIQFHPIEAYPPVSLALLSIATLMIALGAFTLLLALIGKLTHCYVQHNP